jgi:hypothetical protein
MVEAKDFKRVSVRNIRKIIKEMGLKAKNPNLKGYSYKKKAVLVQELVNMNINPEAINAYKKAPRVMSDSQKKALADGRRRKKEKSTTSTQRMKQPIKVVVDVAKEDVIVKPKVASQVGDKFLLYATIDGRVKKIAEYNSINAALKEFNRLIEEKKYKKTYIVEKDRAGEQEIIRSYKNPKLYLGQKNRLYKKHMMYKDGKSEMADDYDEHLKLKEEGWKHNKQSKQKQPKQKKLPRRIKKKPKKNISMDIGNY